MNYTINIDNKLFEVSIDDINKRPIVAHVNGREFLVNPVTNQVEIAETVQPASLLKTERSDIPGAQPGILSAPLPGTVIEVFVKPGDKVEAGQVILIIEAMKMKNSIRTTIDGTVAAVLVIAGQSVAHKQGLVEFRE